MTEYSYSIYHTSLRMQFIHGGIAARRLTEDHAVFARMQRCLVAKMPRVCRPSYVNVLIDHFIIVQVHMLSCIRGLRYNSFIRTAQFPLISFMNPVY